MRVLEQKLKRIAKFEWRAKYVLDKFIRWYYNLYCLRYSAKELIDKKDLVIVEVGCSDGANAKTMLDSLDVRKMYLIDAFISYDSHTSKYGNLEKNYAKAKKLSKKYDNVILIKGTSADVVNKIPQDVDYVYIDANHSYEYVKQDIELYYPKVKKGGMLAGHDFNGQWINDVCKAVFEFTRRNNLRLYGMDTDWWIIK